MTFASASAGPGSQVRRPRRSGAPYAKRLPSSRRRVQLLDAARDVIRTDGLAMVTMGRVADRAGVSKPVLYTHFANRSAILIALITEFWDDIDRDVITSTERNESSESFAGRSIATYFDALERGGAAIQAILSTGGEEPEVEAVRLAHFRKVEEIWGARYQRSLGLSPDAAHAAAGVLRSAIAGAGAFFMAHPEVSSQECRAVCEAVVVGGMKELKRRAASG
jgi:AcrR family transcriptional regulator